MRSTFKVLFYANGSKEKNGAVPIMGRVTVNGQVTQFSCKLSVPASLWDAKGNRAKGKGDEAQRINHVLGVFRWECVGNGRVMGDRVKKRAANERKPAVNVNQM